MIAGLGNDIIEVERLQRELDREGGGLRDDVFTPAEIAYCQSMAHPAEHFAARWAAKEALFKALGTGYRNGLAWRDVEVQRDDLGKPTLVLSGRVRQLVDERRITNLLVSLSHTRTVAAASVVLETSG